MAKATYKLDPLVEYLNGLPLTETSLSFAEIEAMTGPLPKSAKIYPQWWENGRDTANRPQRKAMLRTPYDSFLRPVEQRVLFKRRGDL